MATQTDEKRKEGLSGAPSGGQTATGQAKEDASGAEEARLKGTEDRPAPEGGPEKGDFAPVDYPEPSGAQAEPANFTFGGTIPSNMVSSTNGFVPVSAVSDPEEALERTLASTRRIRDDRKLSEEELEAMDGPSVRAIGVQRGYEMPDLAGGGVTRRRFLAQQEKDEAFSEKKEGKSLLDKVRGK
jgi:hypothetical protein